MSKKSVQAPVATDDLSAQGTADDTIRQEIAESAYRKWEDAGRPEGDGLEFWVAAEQEVLSK